MSLITCKSLGIGYDNRIIIDNLSFEINAGDYLIIIGENGTGKSTLIKTIVGLLKSISGELLIDDKHKNSIGYLPQKNNYQSDFPAVVSEIVRSGLLVNKRINPFYNKGDYEKVKEALSIVGLEGFEKRPFSELSGGQQQRVLLARTLINKPSILVLDEPMASLDPKVSSELYDKIKELNNDGIAIVMVSHDTQNGLKDASKVLYLGKDVFCGSKEGFTNSAIGKLYLDRKE